MSPFRSIVFLACAAVGAAAQEPARERGVDPAEGLHASFDALLSGVVRNERVDYLRVRDERVAELDGYLQSLAAVDPSTLTRDERLAFYLNLYNATMIRAVAERFVAGWTPAADDFAVFSAPLVALGDRRVSLDHLEHEIVRREFDEPRIHVALVCGAVSCPPLEPRAFVPADLDARLARKMRAFLADESRNLVTAERLELSRIFDWFQADFGGSGAAVRSYVDRYTAIDVSSAEVGYREYDWSLNIAAPREGRWMRVVDGPVDLAVGEGETVRLRDGEVVEVVSEEGSVRIVRVPFREATVEVPGDRLREWRPVD